MPFPLIRLPMRVVYVDDDYFFLNALRTFNSKIVPAEYFESPLLAIERIHSEAPIWSDLVQLISEPDDELTNGRISKFVNRYFNDPRRFMTATVIVVDYELPGVNGLDLIRQIAPWPGKRILLTGRSSHNLAIKSFNSAIIDQFIEKSAPHTFTSLRGALEDLHLRTCEVFGNFMRHAFQSWQLTLLNTPAVAEALRQQIHQRGWNEYVVIGRPFGILGLTENGLQWMQLETAETLADLVELMDAGEFDPTEMAQAKTGALIANSEAHTELQLPGRATVKPTEILCQNPTLYSAVFPIDCPSATVQRRNVESTFSDEEHVDLAVRNLLIIHGLNHLSPAGDKQAAANHISQLQIEAALEYLARLVSKSSENQAHFQNLISTHALPTSIVKLVVAAVSQQSKAH